MYYVLKSLYQKLLEREGNLPEMGRYWSDPTLLYTSFRSCARVRGHDQKDFPGLVLKDIEVDSSLM